MSSFSTDVRDKVSTPQARKFIRYTAVSVIAVIVTMTVQVLCYGVFHFKGWSSAVIASSVAAVPSFYLNRNWVWKKGGRSHLMKEVLPFWIMAAIGLGFSTLASAAADTAARNATDSHALRTAMVSGASLLAFGGLWIFKFIIFNKILFAHHEEDLDPALDGRTGLPT